MESKRALVPRADQWPSDTIVFVVCALLCLLFLWRAGAVGAVGLVFRQDLFSALPSLFSSLLLVSLFVERVIEVFVSVWSDRQSAVHQQNLEYWQSRQARLDQEVQKLVAERDGTPAPDSSRKVVIDQLLEQKRNGSEEADAAMDVEEKALLPFEARTRKVSTWIGLVVGMFTAAVGFRFLAQIVDLSALLKPTDQGASQQYGWFVVADVLLTGAVLAGGSKLVHQIFSVYNTFMDATQKSLAGNKNGG